MIRSKHITKVRQQSGKSSFPGLKCRWTGMSITSIHVRVDPRPLLGNPSLVRHGKRGNMRSPRAFACVTVCVFAGCLPVGTPPAGQHVIGDRTLTGVFLSPSEQDGVPSNLLVTGPSHGFSPSSRYSQTDVYDFGEAALSDLYAVPFAGVSSTAFGLTGRQPVVKDMVTDYRAFSGGAIPTDSQGRLVIAAYEATNDSVADGINIESLDVATGATRDLGAANVVPSGRFFVLSPGRTRIRTGALGAGNLCDLDQQVCHAFDEPSDSGQGTMPANTFANTFNFIGEDFYDVELLAGASGVPGGSLNRMRPFTTLDPPAQTEVLLSFTGSVTFRPILGDRTPQLLLSLATDTGDAPFALLDTDTLKTSALPPEKGQAQFAATSSDGHWLAFVTTVAAGDSGQPADHRIFIYDWTTGSFAKLDSERVGQAIGTYLEWRPGRSELWFSTANRGLGIWRPDGVLATVHATLVPYLRAPEGRSSVFTRDGRHFFSVGSDDGPTISVGSSDDPTGPLQPLNPRGTKTTSYWETVDGRLLVGAWTLDGNRKDIYLVDADASTSRAIASNGHLVALGHTRALAMLNWESSRSTGDLVLVDLASGAHTLLAENVYDVAVDRGWSATVSPDTDALAPGTRVAYLTSNRLASPWDGLWVAALP